MLFRSSPETFGLVGVEAMSHGLPTIAARVGGIGEWLEDGKTGLFFESGNVPELAACVERLWRSPAEARRLGAAGQRACQHRFTPARHADALMDVFSTLVEDGPGDRSGNP